ncbi:sensor histidine kinase [Aureimonas leprariae]|uniref:Blue-light-activated histidine kinase n=1 Tax=Plantimonas leprariae TaxID=2615207 RepID=A0A7V7PQU2_9HYPH|nr:HWE histidine kinase domain-containing protein [Aureimonas leprariae]KAB0680802.1 PAS domain-containing protein [Aureimonas leprariae]
MIDFESLFASIPSPYMVLDARFNYVAANRAYSDVVKLAPERLIGNNLFELFPNDGEEGQRLRRSLQSVLDTGKSNTIAFIPYAIPRPEAEGGGTETRYWTAVHTPLRGPDGGTAFVLQNTVDVTELVHSRAGADGGSLDMLQRAREAERAYRDTLAESEEFRRLFAQAPGMIAVFEGADHLLAFANDAYKAFAGDRPLKGRAVREIFPDLFPEGEDVVEWLDIVFRSGKPKAGEGIRVVIGGGKEPAREVFIDLRCQPIFDSVGTVTGVFVQGTDRTDQYLAMHRLQLLLDELNHRVKNTLSTVQSIARRSFRDADSAGLAAFEARIKALSAVHDILSDRHWEEIGLETLLRQEIAAFGENRVAVAGPAIGLTPRAAIALSMVFHELASNAVKYGVLAMEEGSLSVGWSVDPDDGDRLRFEWREDGNGSAPADWSRGFGMRTLRRIIEGELDGTLALDLAATGFICRFDIALDEVGKVAG